MYLRNALPIDIKVSVAGCSVKASNNARATELNVSPDLSNVDLAKEEFLDYGEKVVNPGDVLHLPTVKLSSRNKENKSYLVIRVCIIFFICFQLYLLKSEFLVNWLLRKGLGMHYRNICIT